MTQTSLGHRLRLLRVERQLSLRQAAARAGVVKETISDIERGVTHPQDVTLAKLAKAYGVPVEDLLEKEPLLLSLEEIHASSACESSWLVKSEEEWREAWEEISSPKEAVMAVFDLGDEYSLVRKRIAEQDPALALPHMLISGPYKQAFVRWLRGLENAKSCGVAAGRIGIADTLDDLVKELGLVDEMRRREEKRKERGAESLEGMPLAS